ncbi:MAG: hypothetical protein KC503_10540 [Myxococcales bacterium]|nr:hypothetical protein [Myxococcales bacterium]
MTAPKPSNSKATRLAIFFVIYGLHVAVVFHAIRPSVIESPLNYEGVDYQTHLEQTKTIAYLLERYGHLWGYDPNLLAGQPAGLIFDVDNKLHFLFSYGIHRLTGARLIVAFKLFPLISSLLAPLILLLAARMLRLDWRQSLCAFGLCVFIWLSDHATRFMWGVGMISFATASYLSVLAAALFFRYLTEPSIRRLAATALTLAIALNAHVWAFAILVVPLIGTYVWHWRKCEDKTPHIGVWAIALVALGANLYWLAPALRFFKLVAPSGIVGQTGPWYLLTDYLEVLINAFNTFFSSPHTLGRFGALFAAFLTLRSMRREDDPRWRLGALAIGWSLFLAFFIALIPGLREMEPYRFVVPATLFAAVLAAPWLCSVATRELYAGLSPAVRALLIFLLLLVVPRVAGHIFYAVPELIPYPSSTATLHALPRVPGLQSPQQVMATDLSQTTHSLRPVPEIAMKLARYIDRLPEEGRIVVQHWALGELLRHTTNKSILGGFPDRRLKHEAAHLFRRPQDPRLNSATELAHYLVRYNARYLVMTDFHAVIEFQRRLFEFKHKIGPHRIYRVRHRGNYFMRGNGNVRALINRIEVRDAVAHKDTQQLVLRFHYLRTMRCRPRCRIFRVGIPFDDVGFIGVEGTPTLPRTFILENGY